MNSERLFLILIFRNSGKDCRTLRKDRLRYEFYAANCMHGVFNPIMVDAFASIVSRASDGITAPS